MNRHNKLLVDKCLVIQARHKELNDKMADCSIPMQEQITMKKEISNLDDSIDIVHEFNKKMALLNECVEIIDDKTSDPDLITMAKDEIPALKECIEELVPKIKDALLPKNKDDLCGSILLEVRAGTGGDEASRCASEIFKMYLKFAALKGLKVEIIAVSENGVGG